MKIMVASPTYDGKLDINVAINMVNEKAVSMLLGDDLVFEILRGCSHPAMGRNQLVQTFVDSDCERLVFVDSDLLWEAGSACKIAHFTQDFVGGCYRLKYDNESYPISWLPDPDKKGLFSNENGLIEVAGLPGGFMSLSRNVFETIRKAHPNREFTHLGNKLFAYFEMKYEGGALWSEDMSFCKMWRDLGGKVFLDPSLRFSHLDFKPTPFDGCIGQWLGGMRPQPTTKGPENEL